MRESIRRPRLTVPPLISKMPPVSSARPGDEPDITISSSPADDRPLTVCPGEPAAESFSLVLLFVLRRNCDSLLSCHCPPDLIVLSYTPYRAQEDVIRFLAQDAACTLPRLLSGGQPTVTRWAPDPPSASFPAASTSLRSVELVVSRTRPD